MAQRLRVVGRVDPGHQFLEAKIEAAWRKNRHLTTAFTLEQNWLRLEQGDFNTSLAMVRLDYSITPFITLANFVQYDSESRNIGLQSRLRWILTPGNEFFVVLNQGWQENQLDRFEAAQTAFGSSSITPSDFERAAVLVEHSVTHEKQCDREHRKKHAAYRM